MKLLKTIGKVIALPFDLALILGKLLLIPIKLVSVLLHGEFIEWNKKRKFIGNSIKVSITVPDTWYCALAYTPIKQSNSVNRHFCILHCFLLNY